MQRRNIETLKAKLLSHLDDDCGVRNVEGALAAVKELIEHQTTQEELEKTRLGRYVNEFRKKTSHVELSKKAKELLKKYQNIISEAAGTKNVRKKDTPQSKNGICTPVSAPPPLPNCSQVSENGGQLNGRVKNSSHTQLVDTSREKPIQSSDAKSISFSSSSKSHSNANNLKNGTVLPVPPSSESLKRSVNNAQVQSKRTAAPSPIPKDLSVINGSSSPSTSNHHKVICDTVSATSRKRHLDVPSANSSNTNAKRTRFENAVSEPTVVKPKLSNGIVPDATVAEKKVFTCKMSQNDLKFLFKSETVNSSAVSSPSLSTKNSSSSTRQDLPRPNIVHKPRKVQTTKQLLQKMHKNGELCSIPSQTIYNITSNQVVKEHSEDKTVAPSEAKLKSHKRHSKMLPPTGTGDLTEVKNELVQKFLSTSVNSNVGLYGPESPETKVSEIEYIRPERSKTEVPVDISKLDPDSPEYMKELLRNPDAFLPPLPDEEILCDHEKEIPRTFDSSAETVEKLFNTRVPGTNGQYDFRNEWRTLDKQCSVRSTSNSFLNILPYCCLE